MIYMISHPFYMVRFIIATSVFYVRRYCFSAITRWPQSWSSPVYLRSRYTASFTDTRGKVPAYMGSSFAFIIPMTSLLKTVGYPAVAQGIISVGLVYLVVAFIVTFTGTAWIEYIFPAEVVGPIIMVIGLSLAGSAASSATTMNGHYDIRVFTVALVTLLATIAFNMFLRGFLGLLPVLLGIIFGYIVALITGLVDLSPVASAHWFQLPNFETFIGKDGFVFYPAAVLSMAPLALVTLSEHLGHLMVLSKITGTDF